MPKKYDGRIFAKLHIDITNTSMWKELTAHEVFVYTELLSKRSQGKFGNSETYLLTPGMMKGRIAKPTFYKAITKLIKCGFIEIYEHGGVGATGQGRANIYILSTKWQGVLEIRKQHGKDGYLLARDYALRYRPKQKKAG